MMEPRVKWGPESLHEKRHFGSHTSVCLSRLAVDILNLFSRRSSDAASGYQSTVGTCCCAYYGARELGVFAVARGMEG